MADSITESVIYLVFSIICWFYLFHHPAHIGISAVTTAYSLNTDQTHLHLTPLHDEANEILRSTYASELSKEQEITIIDVVTIRELILLVSSYILRDSVLSIA